MSTDTSKTAEGTVQDEQQLSARATAKFVRVTPMKARRVIDLIRGKDASDALDILRFAPQAASEPVGNAVELLVDTDALLVLDDGKPTGVLTRQDLLADVG